METSGQSATPRDDENAALAHALDQLWLRFLPEIRQRVAVLASAAASVRAQTLTREEREGAHAMAHKLAGVLGTFSLTRGTELARELEETFSREGGLDADSAARITAIVAEIQTMVENRGPAPA
jgi:HPt (histidine-containing phosphotransfer) domain-containing protein